MPKKKSVPDTLVELEGKIAACDKKVQAGENLKVNVRKLQDHLNDRTEQYLDALRPLRAAVWGIHGKELEMATTKKWNEDFEHLQPPEQEKLYADVTKHTAELLKLFSAEHIAELLKLKLAAEKAETEKAETEKAETEKVG